jgi:hypothetical protein
MNEWDRRKVGQSDAERLRSLVSPYGAVYRLNLAIVRRCTFPTLVSEEDRISELAVLEEDLGALLQEVADLQARLVVDAGKEPTRQSNSGQREVIGSAAISQEDGQGKSISTSHDQGKAK